MHELVTRYQPEVIWSDGEWEAPYQYWKATEFIAWWVLVKAWGNEPQIIIMYICSRSRKRLYNESPVRKTVVTNDRWGHDMLCKHGDFYTCSDRYNPGVLQLHKWENAMTIDKRSWGHRANAKLEDFLTSEELIEGKISQPPLFPHSWFYIFYLLYASVTELITTVSCGGNILINVGPSKYGTIEPIFEERLRHMGRWLRTNGEAIYSSVPWTYQNDTQTPGVWYTSASNDKPSRSTVYAIVLNYPYDSAGVNLFALGGAHDALTTVELLGYPGTLQVEQTFNFKFRTENTYLLYIYSV